MAENTLTITGNADPALAALKAVEKAASGKPELLELFRERFRDPSKLFRVNVESDSATPAGEFRVSFEPSDAFRDFLSAIGAGEIDGL